MKFSLPNMRLGSTSFLVHKDYVSALSFVSEHCEDVALLLIDTGENGEYLPSHKDVEAIADILEKTQTSLHIHLPTTNNCESEKSRTALYDACLLAIERTKILKPHSFVLHVDLPSFKKEDKALNDTESQQIKDLLAKLASNLPSPQHLAIENLEGYSPHFWDFCFENTGYSRCLDVGHLWKDGLDPLPFFSAWQEKIRLIHLHGLAPNKDCLYSLEKLQEMTAPLLYGSALWQDFFGNKPKDHKSLENMPPSCIDAFMHCLWKEDFRGHINIEVFDFADFISSCAVLEYSWKRFEKGITTI